MKKLLLMFAVGWMAAGLVMAGGIVTNTNQSASWVRMPARDATRNIDAVFYNPAGLFKLSDGFHFSINNQYITQKQEVENFYKGPGGTSGLNQSLYKGTVIAPLFPGIYGVYKKGNIAISFGINPIGGGGGAEFKNGLPFIELDPSDMVPTLSGAGATAYHLDQYFKGSSLYMGYQLGVSYKINDMLSVFGGARYVSVKNSYLGHIKGVQVNMGGNWVNVNDAFAGLATQATGAAAGLHPLIAGGLGGLTPAQAQGAGFLTPVQAATIVGGLTAMGVPNASALTIGQDSLAYMGAAAKFTGTSTLTGALFNQAVDVVQNGSGITPILGLNLSFGDKLNIGIKYEFATKIDITNKTTSDIILDINPLTGAQTTMFPDGAKTHNDMPAYLSVGGEYAATDKLNLALGLHYYFDRAVNYGKSINNVPVDNKTVIDKNFVEIAAGLEYKISSKLLVSAGYLMTQTGVNKDFQSGLNFDLNTNTIGLGLQYAFTDKVKLNLGYAYTAYTKGDKLIDHTFKATGTVIQAKETYWKNTQIISLGLDLSF